MVASELRRKRILKDREVARILSLLRRKLGGKLAAAMGRQRLRDIAVSIADYKEEASWPNTDNEVRRLRERIRSIEASAGVDLHFLRLSKKSEAKVFSGLRATLVRSFPSMKLNAK